MFNRAEIVDQNLRRLFARYAGTDLPTAADPDAPVRPGCSLTGSALLELFDSQMLSRQIDLVARELRAKDQGYYTIGSAGHEGNVVLGRVCKPTDPAFLHYRSGALMAERSRHRRDGGDFVVDTLLGMVASRDDPVAGGRHKVWGSRELWVPPQTSTIGSHPPKALGMAIALERAHRMGHDPGVPADAIVLCTFGDASANHSAAQGAFNAAAYAAARRLPAPVLFVCEDNGLGISVSTPDGWIESSLGARRGLTYFGADGLDVVAAYRAAEEAVAFCRTRRAPALLHLKVVRLLGHAGSDFEPAYRTQAQIEAAEARDPLLRTAAILIESGVASPEDLAARYQAAHDRVREAASQVAGRPGLHSAADVTEPLAPYDPAATETEARRLGSTAAREQVFGGADALPEHGPPRHLAVQINRALTDLMIQHPQMVVFGEDVAQKGGVYHVTHELQARFGPGRVFDTLLDETTILGLAQGCGAAGLLPVPEIQYLAYLHNAEDQLRGEAASLQFFSQAQFQNPMVVRIASFGYQKGFGGHFHNDNSIAVLRDIPGLVICAPARGDDAVRLLRTCLALAAVNGRVVAFLEPIARYMTKDLYQPGDGAWLSAYPPPGEAAPFGEGRLYEPPSDGEPPSPDSGGDTEADVLIITYANGVWLSLRAAKTLYDAHGIRARVLDLRWIAPLGEAEIVREASRVPACVVVDEGRRSGGVAEAVLAALAEGCQPLPRVARVTGADTFIPLGPAADLVLPSEGQIADAVVDVTR